MTRLLLLTALLLSGSSLFAQQLKTVPADLIQLKDADLTTVRPLVIAREGVYVCRNGYDMYIKSKETRDAIVKVSPLQHARLMSNPNEKVYVTCVASEQ